MGGLFFAFHSVEVPSLAMKPRLLQERGLDLDGIVEERPQFSLQMPNLMGECTFFRIPPKPGRREVCYGVKLQRSQDCFAFPMEMWMEGSCRLDLRYDETGVLRKGEVGSLFWAEVYSERSQTVNLASVKATGFIDLKSPHIANIGGLEIDEPRELSRGPNSQFLTAPSISPLSQERCSVRVYLQRGDRLESTSFHAECGEYEGGEIPLASPLRILADGRWLGRDLVQKRYGVSVHWVRLRTGAMACEEGGLWSFSEGRWQRGGEGDCLARLVAVKGDHLEWEGWDGDLYVRFRMSFGGEIGWNRQELWSQVRIRSLQQMRGFCERQALAVRVGDWVIKREGIWKILRKPVEREAFLRGEMWGELFIFEGIEKQGKQFIGKGTLFSASRTEEMSIVCRREPKPARMVPFAKGD